MFIVADPEADIYFTSSVLRGNNILVIVGRNATEEYLSHLRERRISYVITMMRPTFAKGSKPSTVSSASAPFRYREAAY